MNLKNHRSCLVLLLMSALILLPLHTYGQEIRIEPELRMLALGDSYTIGESVQVEDRWPHQFIKELKSNGIVASVPDYIARTGWTTWDLIGALNPGLDTSINYNLVSILIGVNNQYQGKEISLYEPQLRKIIKKALHIVEGDPGKVFILSIPDYAYTPFGKGKERISKELDRYNAINKKLAGEYSLPWIDITPISRLGLSDTSLVAEDGLHPSATQYELWVLEILPHLNLLKGK